MNATYQRASLLDLVSYAVTACVLVWVVTISEVQARVQEWRRG